MGNSGARRRADIADLVRRIDGNDERLRHRAGAHLCALMMEDPAGTASAVARAVQHGQRMVLANLVLVYLACIPLAYSWQGVLHRDWRVLLFAGTLVVQVQLLERFRTRIKRGSPVGVWQLVAGAGEPRVVGPMLRALEWTVSHDSKRAIVEALSVSLDLVTRETGHLLGPAERSILYSLPRVWVSAEPFSRRVVCAALSAIGRLGDTQALPHVRELVSKTSGRPDLAEICAAARECCALLEKWAVSDALLRPASCPATPGEMLLRPADRAPDVDSSLLLRPHEPKVD